MKRKATRNFDLRIRLDKNKWKVVQLEEGKIVTPAKLKELNARQIRDYTEEVKEVDLSFLSPEDKRYYRKHKSNPDMDWALDILSYPPTK
ncbi:hypothetical protein Syn7803C34_59 [Synechococcus phage ACG-2014f]|uniref:Uncharacterized protein n=1 Tax=Synechococcus phage ACG-2014f TaxID=1493511 RepID=A0A0E3G6Z4_9CAUD|nr:hypothetical protein Syn7803US17_59 [Synechococcus phage ACG-2014f]AIX28626.1 hypothetical protein Syn7803US24_59 [Synechococcus phage ACG-2014f]AIX30248.1 hypothetical protein Syn7803US36_60 [Synechococcus phage ACG-2014f]AIX32260.1 hypothetical protein Syn7803US44_60 [Synechococcus phage ACG-2014f]AIX45610.1 hypothetical protein Syn7803C34_59 [Synechococcus phage ACG-2014f]